jgi:hypothetical protein
LLNLHWYLFFVLAGGRVFHALVRLDIVAGQAPPWTPTAISKCLATFRRLNTNDLPMYVYDFAARAKFKDWC